MKVTIDPAIEKDPELLDGVKAANSYLERRLDLIPEAAAAWTFDSERPNEVAFRLYSEDDSPAERTVTVPRDRLRLTRYSNWPVGDALDSWLTQQVRFHIRKLQRSLAEVGA
jgi:hypothetical protein